MKKKTAPTSIVLLILAVVMMYFSRGDQQPSATQPSVSQSGPTITFDAPINTSPGTQSGNDPAERGRIRIDPLNIPPQNTATQQQERGDGLAGPRLTDGYRVTGVRIVDNRSGRIMPIDEVDLKPSIERIKRGERDAHRNDGTVYRNLNRKLPQHPNGYYHEYVVPTSGMNGPGPQRLVIGKRGEIYYTWDHYDNFILVEGGK